MNVNKDDEAIGEEDEEMGKRLSVVDSPEDTIDIHDLTILF